MALLHSIADDPGAAIRVFAICLAIALVALVATAAFSGAAPPSFDVTSDPASTLWSW
jgi:hypothetical protein